MGVDETSKRNGETSGPLDHPIRVLYVDADEDHRAAVAAAAERESLAVSVEGVGSVEAALDHLGADAPHCVVSEAELSDGDWRDLWEGLEAAGFAGSFILCTTADPQPLAREAFAAGITDFVQKVSEPVGYRFLLDKVVGAVAGGSQPEVEAAKTPDIDALATLTDERGTVHWASGAIDGIEDADVTEAQLQDAIGEIVAEDERFGTRLARAVGGDDPLAPLRWPMEAGGELELWSYPVGEPTTYERLTVVRDYASEVADRERLERFERLLDTASDGLYALDVNGFYRYVNETMGSVLGYDREELLGIHAANVLGDGEYERGQEHVRQLVRDEERESEVLEMTVKRSDGEEIPVAIHFAPLYDEDGNYDGLVGVLRDISDRKAQERKLRESERRYRTVAENIPNGAVALFDESLDYTMVEGELFDPLSLEAGDFEGDNLQHVHTDSYVSEHREQYERVFDGERSSFEFEFAGRHFRTQLVPIEDAEGAVRNGLALILDITEQRAHERELERQNERLGEFASIVSHDLRNPLNVIEGNLELYEDTGEQDHLETAQEHVERMHALIDELLELARQGQTVGETERLALAAQVEDCWETVSADESTLAVPDDLPTIAADPARLTQLLENLFRNAVEHAGADVSLTVGALEDGFYVADDGPGIPEEVGEDVLEYGVSTRDDGTGIGLAIVREIAKAHGWDIEITESADGGARFEFRGVHAAQDVQDA